MDKKRMRSSNFTATEEDILVEYVLKHSTIIENKQTDACTVKEKNIVWEEISREFNSRCPNVARNTKALKDKYTNIKTPMRKQYAAEKSSCKKNGGGKDMTKRHPRSDALADLANVIAISIHGTSPCIGDDDVEMVSSSSPTVSPPAVSPPAVLPPEVPPPAVDPTDCQVQSYLDELLPKDVEKEPVAESWATYTPSQLRKPRSAKLKRPISSPTPNESTLQSFKKKLLEKELEMRIIEHEPRMKQQQEEHEARMELLAAEKTKVQLEINILLQKQIGNDK